MAPMDALPERTIEPADIAHPAIRWLDEPQPDPAELMLTCANCGAPMDERKCKLICRCGYFLSCSDYL
jgi:hypothetical protein